MDSQTRASSPIESAFYTNSVFETPVSWHYSTDDSGLLGAGLSSDEQSPLAVAEDGNAQDYDSLSLVRLPNALSRGASLTLMLAVSQLCMLRVNFA